MEQKTAAQRTKAFYQALPKVDLHRHLEGSLRLETLIEVARTHGLKMLGTGRLRSLVQISELEPYTFKNFLSKFETLRLFYRSPEIIQRIAREAIADAAADNVRYIEMRFTPVALSKQQAYSLTDVMNWVTESVQQAQKDFQIGARLLASMNRHESPRLAEQVIQLAVDFMGKGVVGIDLAGNEAEFSADAFAALFREARKAGLRICVHAGEWGGASNVAEAIVSLGASRIGHGVRVLEDEAVVALARDRQTVFEVCITSNHQSGVVTNLAKHPLPRMLSAGLNATINTDDPSISQITLSDEYYVAGEVLGLPLTVIKERALAAAEGTFLPEAQRQALVGGVASEFQKVERRQNIPT